MSSTLLQYLAEQNPVLNNVHSLSGLPTRCDPEENIGIENWSDFNYETLMSCYGHVLRRQYSHPFPNNSPPLSALECDIFDEDSLDHLLSRSIVPAVSQGLRKAWEHCYPGKLEIDITRGGRARHTQAQASNEPRSSNSSGSELEGTKMFPDWAGVQRNSKYVYANRCPGETKLSTKWNSAGRRSADYYWPISQLLGYCGKNWRTRYGYIITQKEVVVFRFSREKIGSGLAQGRSPRTRPGTAATQTSAQHQRNDSINSIMSGVSSERAPGRSREPSLSARDAAMSVRERSRSPAVPSTQHRRQYSITSGMSNMSMDRSSGRSRESSRSSDRAVMSAGEQSYEEGHSGGEYRPVEMKSIPWDNHGPGKLTVKLAIWWIHMLAGAPGGKTDIQDHYDHLDTWEPLGNGSYRHVSTGITSTSQPTSGNIQGQTSQRPSTPARQQARASPLSSPLSSPPSSLLTSTPPDMARNLPDVDQIVGIQWDENRRQWRFRTDTNHSGYFPHGTVLWSSRRGGRCRPCHTNQGQVQWVPEGQQSRASGAGRSDRGSNDGGGRSSSSSSSGSNGRVSHNHGRTQR